MTSSRQGSAASLLRAPSQASNGILAPETASTHSVITVEEADQDQRLQLHTTPQVQIKVCVCVICMPLVAFKNIFDLLYWRDASLYTLDCCIEGCISQIVVLEGCISLYIRLLRWRDASLYTLDYCIGGMHLSIHMWS